MEKVVDRLGPAAILTPASETPQPANTPGEGAGGPVNQPRVAPLRSEANSSPSTPREPKAGKVAARQPGWAGFVGLQINQICRQGANLAANSVPAPA